MANRMPVAECFGALTPVALRAPSVSAPNRNSRHHPVIKTKKNSKTLDGCRSLFHTE